VDFLLCNGFEEQIRIADRAENAPLHFDHLQSGLVVSVISGSRAISQEKAFITAITGFTHRAMYTDIGSDAGQHDVLDPRPLEQ
jgi:hypothetical protein